MVYIKLELPNTTLAAFEARLLTIDIRPHVETWPDDPAAAAELYGALPLLQPVVLESQTGDEKQYIYTEDRASIQAVFDKALVHVTVLQTQADRLFVDVGGVEERDYCADKVIQFLCRYWRDFRIEYMRDVNKETVYWLKQARAIFPEAATQPPAPVEPEGTQTTALLAAGEQGGVVEDLGETPVNFASLTDAEFTERQGRLKDRNGYATPEWITFVFGFYYARKKQHSRAVSIDKLAELTGNSASTIDRQKREYDERMRVKT